MFLEGNNKKKNKKKTTPIPIQPLASNAVLSTVYKQRNHKIHKEKEKYVVNRPDLCFSVMSGNIEIGMWRNIISDFYLICMASATVPSISYCGAFSWYMVDGPRNWNVRRGLVRYFMHSTLRPGCATACSLFNPHWIPNC